MAARRPSAGRWTRRQLLETAGGVALIGFLAEACGPAAPSSSAGAGPAAAAATAAPTTAAAATAPVAAATAPVAAATAATTALAAATTAPAVAGPPGGQAIISFGEPDTLLMSESRALVSAYIRSFIANGLVRLKYPDMTVVEDLANKYTVSPDGKTVTFELRPGVKWQDGQAFSSDDVKFTFEYFGHPDNPKPLTSDFANIVGASEFKARQASDISGLKFNQDQAPNRVEISLIAPSNSFLVNVATTVIMPKHILQGVAPADFPKHPFARQPIYTGPFKVDEWKSGESITYSAFADHFKGRPKLDKVVQRIFPDPTTAVTELRSGGVQQAFIANPDQFGEFQTNSSYSTQELAGTLGWFFSWDMTNQTFPFAEKDFRIAVSRAIDRKTLVDALFRGLAEPGHSLASPLSWIYNANIPTYDYDPGQSRQLLDGLGWMAGSDGIRVKNGQRLEYAMMVTSTTKDWFLAMQPMLQAVGIGISKVDVVDFPTWISRLNVGKYESTMNGWGNFAIDPRADLAAHFWSPTKAARGDGTGYKNEQVDQLFAQATTATLQDEEKRLYDQIQMLVEGDCVYAYLFRPKQLGASTNNLVLPGAKIQAEIYDALPGWTIKS
jgi:peptide/nickel transport system substrate-binding protein